MNAPAPQAAAAPAPVANFSQQSPRYEAVYGQYAVVIRNLHGVRKATAYGSSPEAARDCAALIIAAFEEAVK